MFWTVIHKKNQAVAMLAMLLNCICISGFAAGEKNELETNRKVTEMK